jgi:hypothetical protein
MLLVEGIELCALYDGISKVFVLEDISLVPKSLYGSSSWDEGVGIVALWYSLSM